MRNSYIGWKDWQLDDFGHFGHEDALNYAQELEASGIASVHRLKIAELGFGNGSFVGWVRNAGGIWVGREAIPDLQKRAVQAGFEVIGLDADLSSAFGPGKLDLIVAFDVIEHLELDTIRSLLSEAKDSLKEGGLLLFRVLSGDSPFSGAIYHGDFTHRTLLGSSAVRQLAMEAGLAVCQIRSPVLPICGLGFVSAARRIVVCLTRALVFAFVRHILMGNGRAMISPNMIIVLRKEAAPS